MTEWRTMFPPVWLYQGAEKYEDGFNFTLHRCLNLENDYRFNHTFHVLMIIVRFGGAHKQYDYIYDF